MNITDYWANKLFDFQFRAAALAKPTEWHVGLFTIAPTSAGGGTEVAGGSYARVANAPSDANWLGTHGTTSGNSSGTAVSNDYLQVSNAVDVLFPTPTADWGVVNAVGLFDAASAGNLCYYMDIANITASGDAWIVIPVNIRAGDAVRFIAGNIFVRYAA